MPQPIPPGRNISFDFRRDAVMQRPTLTPYIVGISMHWNEIESRLGIFLASLMGGEAQTIVKVFLALRTDGGRKATLDTVTALKLKSADLQTFQEIQKDIGGRYGERNRAIHGAWGISPEYPNELLWYDPRESVAMFPQLMDSLGPDKFGERKALFDQQNKNVRIYTEQDFRDVMARFDATYAKLEDFTKPFVKPLFEQMSV
jgi:hypothetical protein